MTARREVTTTVAEMQAGDEWYTQEAKGTRPASGRPGWRWVEWVSGRIDRLPADLVVTVLRAEPTVEVPLSVIEDVRRRAGNLARGSYVSPEDIGQRILDALADVEVER